MNLMPVLIGGLAMSMLCPAASSQEFCGSALTPEEARLGWALHQGGIYDLRSGIEEELVISVAWHVVENSDGNRAIEDDQLAELLDYLNAQWAPINVTFAAHPLVDRIVNDEFYVNVPDNELLRTIRPMDNALNIYWAPSLHGGGLCGISSFTFSELDSIAMQTECFGYDDISGVFAHEVGHWFDLFHTHEPFYGMECVDGSNCGVAGDLVCDTPACFGLGFDDCVDPAPCTLLPECSEVPGPCADDPVYAPSTVNYMAYAPPPCMNVFTQDQQDRMRSTAENLRGDYTNTGLHDPCPADLDNSFVVDIGDILAVLDEYGCLDGCTSDVNGDGQVGIDDLLGVIDHWGEICFECTDAAACDDGDPTTVDYCWFGTCVHGGLPSCPDGEVADCNGNCAPANWVGNGSCDDGAFEYNGVPIFFNCDAFDCDNGDCVCEDPSGSCWLPDDTCAVLTAADCTAAGGMGWIEAASCFDTDDDRIPDVYELNDCSTPANGFTGTDPNNRDSDGDALPDGDEVYGTLDGLDLPGFGCNPCRQDLLIETDWVYGPGQDEDRNRLHANQAQRVIDAFDVSTVANPDGSTGVTMHIDYGEAPYSQGNSVADPTGDNEIDIPWPEGFTAGEFLTIKALNFPANRQGYFHYCLMCDGYAYGGVNTGSSGLAELNGDDFLVSLGGSGIAGDSDYVGNTFMHELGHNLNLRHGGFENRNYKPNYNSVMSYAKQFCGVDTDGDIWSDGVLDYSHGVNILLDEADLDESLGVTGVGPAIDWNMNGNPNEAGVDRNINCPIGWCGSKALNTAQCNASSSCDDSTCDQLSDHDDWGNISMLGIVPSLLAPEVIVCTSRPPDQP